MHWTTPEAMSPGKPLFFFSCGKACVFQEGRTTFTICSDTDSTLQWMLKSAQVSHNLTAFLKARDICRNSVKSLQRAAGQMGITDFGLALLWPNGSQSQQSHLDASHSSPLKTGPNETSHLRKTNFDLAFWMFLTAYFSIIKLIHIMMVWEVALDLQKHM